LEHSETLSWLARAAWADRELVLSEAAIHPAVSAPATACARLTAPLHNGGVTVRVRRRLVIGALVLSVVIAGGVAAGVAWWRWDTARQPTVGEAVAVLDRAVADVVVAAGPEAAVAVSGVVRSTVCRINAFRQGGVFTANADLYTDPGGEDSLISAVAQRLAGAYPVLRGVAVAGVRPLQASVAGGVELSVRKLSAGWLGVSARTGCSLGAAASPAPASPGDTGAAGITTLFARLGTRAASFTQHRLDCSGGAIVTVAAVSQPVDSSRLAQRLAAAVPAGARRFASGESNRVVYRDGQVSVIVAASDDGTAVTSQYTTACGQ
jgi:hypothetical protein